MAINKKGAMSPLMWGILAVVAILIVSAPAREWALNLIPSGTTPTGTTNQELCFIEDVTVTVGPTIERYNPGTTVSEYHQVFKNGVNKGRYLDGSTLTANPNDEITIVYAVNDSQAGNSGYYAAKQEFTVPCVGEVTTGEMKDSEAYLLFASDASNMSVRVFNEDNGNLNSATDNETLGAGDVVNLQMTFIGTYEDGYSPYGPFLITVDANKTLYDEFNINGAKKVSTPNQHSNKLSSDSQTWTFEVAADKDGMPGVQSNEQIDLVLTVDVDDSTNPGTTGGGLIYLVRYDGDWFINGDNGKAEWGYETDQDADVGLSNPQKLVYVK